MQTTKEMILRVLRERGEAKPVDLVKTLGVSKQVIHRQLAILLKEGKIQRKGIPPFVFYYLVDEGLGIRERVTWKLINTTKEQRDFLDKNYLYITPDGQELYGLRGFLAWEGRTKQNQSIELLISDYICVRSKALCAMTAGGYLDATAKFRGTFAEESLKKVFFSDFYALPKFGKTKLGWQVYYGKASENRKLMLEVATQIKSALEAIIAQEKIDILGFIPHSLPRRIAFLPTLKDILDFSLPEINLVKVYAGEIRVAQKSLPKLENRVENAQKTIAVDKLPSEGLEGKRVLLIDDAVGSGATLHEIASKLQKMAPGVEVWGYAVVGSMNGFEVIKEI